jgi:hypothetical protein
MGPTLNVDLTAEAFEGWNWAAEHYGCTVSSLAEAVGLTMAARRDGARVMPSLPMIAEQAKRIAAQRRRRSH